MARLTGKALFFTTSPRSPEKMVPEIRLLADEFTGKKWDKTTQTDFSRQLAASDYFEGGSLNNPDFSARDRINRAPKALGFVRLEQTIGITPAGQELINNHDIADVLLRQLLKFQLPSPYHTLVKGGTVYRIKPYLEMLRLISHFGSLRFDEIQLFGLQLVNYTDFDIIVSKIEDYRDRLLHFNKTSKTYILEEKRKIVKQIYAEEIARGATHTRESAEQSEKKFIDTKLSNLRDYTDALFRYLRATGLVVISFSGRSLSIAKDRQEEVDYILRNIEREPIHFATVDSYINYLGNADTPTLLNDDIAYLKRRIEILRPKKKVEIDKKGDAKLLKKELSHLIETQRKNAIDTQISELKEFRNYDDVQNIFDLIQHDRQLYDAPLLLEWNTWRAMTMLDGGSIKASLKFDDYGQPMSTAPSNTADIIADYGSFGVAVEVTMTNRQRQFEAEGESVMRHTGKLVTETNKPHYCLLVAPTINPAVVAFFYALHRINISYYGGVSKAVPLSLPYFRKMLENARYSSYRPEPEKVREFFDKVHEAALNVGNEMEWLDKIHEMAINWSR